MPGSNLPVKKYCITSENLALNGHRRGFRAAQIAQNVLTSWKKSPGHRKNLLRKYETEIGVGVANVSNKNRYLSVQLFGRHAALKYSFRFENRSPTAMRYIFDGGASEMPMRVIATHTACQPALLTFHSASIPGKKVPTHQKLFLNSRL